MAEEWRINRLADCIERGYVENYRWQEEGLVVWIYNYDLLDFMDDMFDNCDGLFADGGVEARLAQYTICIPHFERMLEHVGFSEQEIEEMFKKE